MAVEECQKDEGAPVLVAFQLLLSIDWATTLTELKAFLRSYLFTKANPIHHRRLQGCCAPSAVTITRQGKLRLLQEKYGTGDGPDIESEECVSEWESFKRLIQAYSNLSMAQMVSAMVTDSNLKQMYPELTKLATIAAVVPVSTAACERAFSAIKRIKTELRNRMKTSTLDCLMRISIEGPPIESFDFEKAADLWGGMCNRRLSIGSSSSIS